MEPLLPSAVLSTSPTKDTTQDRGTHRICRSLVKNIYDKFNLNPRVVAAVVLIMAFVDKPDVCVFVPWFVCIFMLYMCAHVVLCMCLSWVTPSHRGQRHIS